MSHHEILVKIKRTQHEIQKLGAMNQINLRRRGNNIECNIPELIYTLCSNDLHCISIITVLTKYQYYQLRRN